jgi:hypothetical protein
MRIVRNIGYVKRKKRVAKWSALLGFLLLVATFVMVLNPRLVILAYGLLFGGFIIFNFGMQQIGKWTRNPRNDALLDERLKRFHDRYVLIHYAALGKRTVEHMLVHPGGVLVLTARELPGEVTGRGSHWRRRRRGFMRLFGLSGPQLGNPSLETGQNVAAVEQHLAAAQMEVEVSGAIVFLNPLVELDAEETNFPALTGEQLPEFVRTLSVDSTLRPAERDALVELLSKGEEFEAPTRAKTRRPVKNRRVIKKKEAA